MNNYRTRWNTCMECDLMLGWPIQQPTPNGCPYCGATWVIRPTAWQQIKSFVSHVLFMPL